MNRTSLALFLCLSVLSACSLFSDKDEAVPAAANLDADSEATRTTGYGSESAQAPVEIGGGSASAPAAGQGGSYAGDGSGGNVIYFEYDSVEMTEASKLIVSSQARYLASNPAVRARLEGHADERGTREYNVGLAERRAYAVMQALLAAGATPAQLSVTSYGEERPASTGHDHAAWALNRRVEIIR